MIIDPNDVSTEFEIETLMLTVRQKRDSIKKKIIDFLKSSIGDKPLIPLRPSGGLMFRYT